MPAEDEGYALVTGAASGIGSAIARELMDTGNIVTGIDVQASKLRELADAYPGKFIPIVADVTKEEEVIDAIAESSSRGGLLTRAFNVVAGARLSPLLDFSLDDWRFTDDLTLTSTFLCLREEARIMKEHGGAIVNIASLNARIPAYGFAAYSTAKAAVEMLTRNAALELARHSIRVNAVLPGLVRTPATEAILQAPQTRSKYFEVIPMGRAADALEIAKPAVFLSSNAASYISGVSLIVDGGWSLTGYPDLSQRFSANTQN